MKKFLCVFAATSFIAAMEFLVFDTTAILSWQFLFIMACTALALCFLCEADSPYKTGYQFRSEQAQELARAWSGQRVLIVKGEGHRDFLHITILSAENGSQTAEFDISYTHRDYPKVKRLIEKMAVVEYSSQPLDSVEDASGAHLSIKPA